MKPLFLLDTNICVFILRGKYNLDSKLRSVGLHNCCISEITVAELLYGAECSDSIERNRLAVENLCSKFPIIPITYSIPIFAKQKRELRKQGKLIDDFDLLIASTAIANGFVLVTDNLKHFSRFPLRLENWIPR